MNTELELEIWRIVGRHIELEQSLPLIAEALRRRLPVDQVVVRRLDTEHGRLETVATAAVISAPKAAEARTPCSSRDLQSVASWCREGTVLLADEDGASQVQLMWPFAEPGSVMACPLESAGEPLGVLLLICERNRELVGAHRSLVRCLLDPLTAALRNHLHLHELTRLREGLEADKRALLERLQRDDIVDSLVGCEEGLKEVMERVSQVAPTDVPVLLLGETGTGKEVVARAIHARSQRASGPMLCVNCGAIPAELMDSELFGHERGSFTGAVAARKGWFERADGGTLFLDEFGELPMAAQVRLLRVLQDGVLERVGGQRAMTVDVRVIAATSLDLEAMVRTGRFREDLWYRVSVFPIRLPLLRERREDIPALAAHFAARSGRRLGGAPLVPGAGDIHLLLAYDWPGNVRELASVIERAAILGGGRRLEVAAALGAAHASTNGNRVLRVGLAPASVEGPTGLATLDTAMACHVERALALTRGRIEGPHGAALLLGINPHTLRARMRKLGVEWRRFRSGS